MLLHNYEKIIKSYCIHYILGTNKNNIDSKIIKKIVTMLT